MLRSSLLFPKFIPQKEINAGRSRQQVLYTLDWSGMEKIKKASWTNPDVYYGTLPNPEETDCTFILSDEYLNNIRKHSMEAVIAWLQPKSLEENIPIAHINTAFHLLSDCLYDPDTNYFSRDSERKLSLTYLLLYRFWLYQVPHHKISQYTCRNDFNIVLKDIEYHLNLVMSVDPIKVLPDRKRYLSNRTPRPMPITDPNFEDFITNKIGSIKMDAKIELPLPLSDGLIIVTLTDISLRRSAGEILLSGIVSGNNIEMALANINYTKLFSFDITQTFQAKDCMILSTSALPPASITMKIDHLKSAMNPTYEKKEIKKIDPNKIQRAITESIENE